MVEKPAESHAGVGQDRWSASGSTGDQLVVEPLVVPLEIIVLEVLGDHQTEVTVTQRVAATGPAQAMSSRGQAWPVVIGQAKASAE